MNGLNEAAVSAMAGLPLEDLSYCLKLAKRLERLGVDGEREEQRLVRSGSSGTQFHLNRTFRQTVKGFPTRCIEGCVESDAALDALLVRIARLGGMQHARASSVPFRAVRTMPCALLSARCRQRAAKEIDAKTRRRPRAPSLKRYGASTVSRQPQPA